MFYLVMIKGEIKINYYIGIDGGGTSTKAYLSDENGIILSFAKGDSSNYQVIGIEKCLLSINNVLDDLFKKIELKKEDQIFSYLGLAGIDTDEDYITMYPYLNKIKYLENTYLVNDSDLALAGANASHKGIVLIAGTGSIALAFDENGYKKRVGGWGHIFDDKGSGYDIAVNSLQSFFRSFDGRDEKSLLYDLILEHFKLNNAEEVFNKVYVNQMERKEISKLSKVIFKAYEKGDEKAKKIIINTALELSELIIAVLKEKDFNINSILKNGTLEVPLVGGIFKSDSNLLFDTLKNNIEKFIHENKIDISNVIFSRPKFNPAIGGILLAMKKKNICIDEKIIENLKNGKCIY